MSVRILLNGCNGRMGRVISEALKSDPTCTVVAGIDLYGGSPFGYPVFSSPASCDLDFDVIIDFSNPAALPAICEYAQLNSKAVVIATTGLNDAMKALYMDLSRHVPVFVSANMSLGINMLIQLVSQAASVLSGEFDIEILEAHHNQKLDAPSGTALMIADAIRDNADIELEYTYDRHQAHEPRPKSQLGIHSIRGGTIVGDHTVFFAGKEEVLEITHRAQSRNVFAQGAIAAAKYLPGLPAGLYTMKDLIGSRTSD
ncbi:MAG: 4-hydroxy-tetrahydrodipicolinate reductase [Saccharofermentanales bacterium]